MVHRSPRSVHARSFARLLTPFGSREKPGQARLGTEKERQQTARRPCLRLSRKCRMSVGGEASMWSWNACGDREADPDAERPVVMTIEMNEPRLGRPGNEPTGRRGDAHHTAQEEPQGEARSSRLRDRVTSADSGNDPGGCAQRGCHRQTWTRAGHLTLARHDFRQSPLVRGRPGDAGRPSQMQGRERSECD
jgi:hypothetical protein